MGFSFDIQISALTVFLQGIVSFFSPCILPLLPLYIGYLSGGTKTTGEDGRIQYDRRKVMGNTLFFVVGVSFAFLLLGLGMTAAGRFFHSRQQLFARIGGGIVFLFGLYQLGVFGTASALEREYRLPFRMEAIAMSPVTAFLMGFTFSFAWTPCVGPALASVLLMAASASTQTAGLLLIGVYTAGFVLPFLAVGFFAASLLGFFKRHGQVVKYTVKAGGVLMLLMGALMFTGKLNPAGAPPAPREATQKAEEENEPPAASKEPETEAEETLPPAIDFTLTDQFGNSHTLSDYKGKVIFLNFWATWCPPCRAEMPDIQKIYEEYQENGDDSVVILGVAGPSQGQEQTKQGITDFLEENGYTYPVLMDESGEQFAGYGVYSLPTTFMIDADGNVFGYVSGRIDEAVMRDIIRQTLEGKRH
ncbi:MAG: redoxin domain-containing protein [Lachnospiraceae bacterium]|jgi:cytochrome c-type biogenesis protein|nr:redoxin domain-containing protein [Lachnospiraceae bacterium]